MGKRRAAFILLVFAIVCALGVCGLSACSGGSGGQSDEDAIEEHVTAYMGEALSPDYFIEKTRDHEDLVALEEYGFDLEKYARNYANTFAYKVVEVNVDGDTAVAKVEMTMPVLGDELNAMLDKYTADIDFANMDSEEEVYAAFWNAYSDALADPDLPQTTGTLEIAYAKKGGKWDLADEQGVADDMEALLTAAS